MKIKNIAIVVLLVMGSCKSTTDTVKSNKPRAIVESGAITGDIQPEISLADYLRRFSGVRIIGSGSNTKVFIRTGTTQANSNSEPLFLINGVAFNGSFAQLTGIVPVDNIESVRVYKNASEVSMYGMRGANGVIDITLK